MADRVFVVLAWLALIGVVCDFWFGPTMRRRGLFHAVLVVICLSAAMMAPSCSTGDQPDLEFDPERG